MIEFDQYIHNLIVEDDKSQQPPAPNPSGGPDAGAPPAGDDDLTGELENSENFEDEFKEDEPVFPEEIELAKLAVRAIYFDINSKDVHNLKLRTKDHVIPFEKISDYFEKTKNIIPILGFIEWSMNKYEGQSSKWTEEPEMRNKSIVEKIRKMNNTLSKEERLDNGKRVYWTRIILNGLLRGNPDFNINISDINETNIKEIFRLLKQYFGTDSTEPFPNPTITGDFVGPASF